MLVSIGILFPVASALAGGTKGEGEAVVQTPAEFYKDKTEFLCDVKVGFFKRLLAGWIARREMKKISSGR